MKEKSMKKLLILVFLFFNSTYGIRITESPIFSIELPLSTTSNIRPEFNLSIKEDKKRYSTCTSASWYGNDILMVSNLFDRSIYVYKINQNDAEIIQIIDNLNGNPELDDVSKDKKYYAVSLYDHIPKKESIAKINLYSILENGRLSLIKTIPGVNGEYNTHGVRFSPDVNLLAFTTINRPGYINIYKKIDNIDDFEPCFSLENALYPLKPKGIDFSPDSQFLAAVYSLRASTITDNKIAGIAIYKLNSKNGSIDPNPVYISKDLDLCVPENVVFYPNGLYLFISNQGNDAIVVYKFNPQTGQILNQEFKLSNPKAQLSFPHGFSISPNGKYLSVCNYGTNKVNIYEISDMSNI